MKRWKILLMVILLIIVIFTVINADNSVGEKILTKALFWAPEDGTYGKYEKGECLVFIRDGILKGVFPGIKIPSAGYDNWRNYREYWSKLSWTYDGEQYYISEIGQNLKDGQPGDILQTIGSKGPHTAIIVCIESSGVRVVDSNYDKDLKIKNHLIVWKSFEGKDCYVFRVFEKLDIEKLKSQVDTLPENGRQINFYIKWSSVALSCPKPGDQLILTENNKAIAKVELFSESWGSQEKLWFKAKILRGDFLLNTDYNFVNLTEPPEPYKPENNNLDINSLQTNILNLPKSSGTIEIYLGWPFVRYLVPKPGDWIMVLSTDYQVLGLVELTSEARAEKEKLWFNTIILNGTIPYYSKVNFVKFRNE